VPEHLDALRTPNLLSAIRVGLQALGEGWRASRGSFIVVVLVRAVSAPVLGLLVIMAGSKVSGKEVPSSGGDFDVVPLLSAYAWLFAFSTLTGLVQMAGAHLAGRMGRLLRQVIALRFYAATSALSLRAFEEPATYERLYRIHHRGVSSYVGAFGGAVEVAYGSLGIMLALTGIAVVQPPLIVVVVASLPPLLLLNRFGTTFQHRGVAEAMSAQRMLALLGGLLMDRAVAKELRAYQASPLLLRKVEDLLQTVADWERRQSVRTALVQISTTLAFAIVAGGWLLLLTWLVQSDRLSGSELVVAVVAVPILVTRMTALVRGLEGLRSSAMFASELLAFLRDTPAVNPAEHPLTEGVASPPTVEGRQLSFTYPGTQRAALRSVDIRLEAGRTTALVGLNGSGKTTFAKLLAELHEPDAGILAWDGSDHAPDREARMRSVGVLFQDFVHYPLSMRDNIALGAAPGSVTVEEAVAAAGVEPQMQRLAKGLPTPLSREVEGGAELSGGEWQRLALARLMYRDAKVIVMDEPTAALDVHAEYDLYTRVQEMFRDRTVLLISHRLWSVRKAHHIYVLHDGEVAEHGSHEHLLALGGRYAEMFRLQAAMYGQEAAEPGLVASRVGEHER